MQAPQTMAAAARRVDAAEAAALLAQHYGLDAELTLLSAERDQNFHARCRDGRELLLKLTHPSEDLGFIALQTGAYRHVARTDPGLPVPSLLATTTGTHELMYRRGAEPARIVRVFDFMPGEPLHRMARSRALRENLGRALARLDLALASYHPQVHDQNLLWDLQHGRQLRPLLAHVEDQPGRALAEGFLDRIEARSLPALAGLRRQVIHNDLQPWNVLVDAGRPERITGIIDFGDIVEAPRVCDVAVACAYHLEEQRHVLDGAAELLAAYHRLAPLDEAELAVLPDLIALRLVMTVAITAWRVKLHPDNAGYILRNVPLSWRGLARLQSVGHDEALQHLQQACARGEAAPST